MSHPNITQVLDARKDQLAVAITDAYYETHPELDKRYGKPVRHYVLQDNKYHLTYLSEAVAAGHPSFFRELYRLGKSAAEWNECSQ